MNNDKNEKLMKKRHSLSHILAMAFQKLYPDAVLAIGPAIDTGFYYDFDTATTISEKDLAVIEAEMRTILKKNYSFEHYEMSIKEAIDEFRKKKEIYKVELVEELSKNGETKVSIYKSGDWFDLCKGPHVEKMDQIDGSGLLLDRVSGAYWKGDEKNKMLQRVYGLYFNNKKELDEYLFLREEAKKRDHRKIGKELDLFSFHEEAGAGLAYWHPKGGRIRLAIENFWRNEHVKNGYELLFTPHIGKSWLWETSGHLSFYNENMYSPMKIDKQDFFVKPMNCPFHILIYNSNEHSYRDLPYRWAELGTVYRYEDSGVLHGMLRVRGFTQDDAHIICTPEQVEDEIHEVLRFSIYIWKSFGFSKIKAYLATKPEKSIGSDNDWDTAMASLKKAIEAEKLDYEMDIGGGAFYGPKIDLKITDALGREWQMTTIQFDFNLSERFDMKYKDSDGLEKRPYMVHRALLGSLERFFGILVENYAGKFPLWLSPIHLVFIPVAESHAELAQKVMEKFKIAGLRVEVDFSNETLNKKMVKARNLKIPYIAVIGDKEIETNTVSIKNRDTQKQSNYTVEQAIELILNENNNRSINLSV